MNSIRIRGARAHNLKNITVKIPRDKLVVVTGLSGSGKSSLAFDTIYAEGQRRYVESLSAYARQFLGRMEKPDVDDIEGLSPAISIDQKGASRNPRSTVGTVTEIHDYLRLLFARVGRPFCPQCGDPIEAQTVDQMSDRVLALPEGTRVLILAPLVRGRKGEYQKLFEEARRQGFARVRVNGVIQMLDEEIKLARYQQHTIEVVVDRIAVSPSGRSRLVESMETALKIGKGTVAVAVEKPEGEARSAAATRRARGTRRGRKGALKGSDDPDTMIFSEHFACPKCGLSFGEITPRLFSFNSPYGACPDCGGLGTRFEVDENLIIFDPEKSIEERGILPWGITTSTFYQQVVRAVAREEGVPTDKPIKHLPKGFLRYLLHGAGQEELIRVSFRNRMGHPRIIHLYFNGLLPLLQKRYQQTESDYMRSEIEKYMTEKVCSSCHGARLKPEALSVRIGGKNIAQFGAMTVRRVSDVIGRLELTEKEQKIAEQVLKEIRHRLQFLLDVGLDYLTLDRAANTLAGGEAQRIRLATQIGSGLIGVLYILDEPSIGLHARDQKRLLDTLKKLRDLGNSVIVVEHDEETIRAADHVLDLGPGAGLEGGYVVAQGTPDEIVAHPDSLTGKYLSGRLSIPLPKRRRPAKAWLTILGAKKHNLKGITVRVPLGCLVGITGVSGSGKSTLVEEVLYRGVSAFFHGSGHDDEAFEDIKGLEYVDKVIVIDQSPIGRTPRSNPATYTKVFDHIRYLFAQTADARARGYKPGRFSFNVRGGRCEACQGDGLIKIEMHFLPDVYVPCEACEGRRYNRETLQVLYKGKNISEVLRMRVQDALAFFDKIPAIRHILQTLHDVGLGYIELGQPATTLSGGEAQRVKLASELCRKATGDTLYILDEPTTGLHFADVEKLIGVLQRLVEAGNTVVVIEHNLDVIKSVDYIVDLGPEGGDRGGEVVAQGTPEAVAKVEASYTGKFLRQTLDRAKAAKAKAG